MLRFDRKQQNSVKQLFFNKKNKLKKKYWSGLPFPSPWDLSNPGIEHGSSALQVDYLTTEVPGKHQGNLNRIKTDPFLKEHSI